MRRRDRRLPIGGRLGLAVGLSLVLGGAARLLGRRARPGAAPAGTVASATAAREPSFHAANQDVPQQHGDHGRPQGYGSPGTPPDREAERDGYEPRDANPRSIAIVMAVGVALIAGSIWGLFVLLGQFHAHDRSGRPLTAAQRASLVPPGPPLQSSPLFDIASLRAREGGRLENYAWIDPDHTTARIPIERAMALTVGKSLDPAP